jgi:hypothetical protein
MSFFKIIDVITNSNGNRLGGPSSLGGKQYERNTYRFPEDVGSYDKGHYILFNINEQVNTQFYNSPATGDKPTVIANNENLIARRGAINVAGSATQLGTQLSSAIQSGISNFQSGVNPAIAAVGGSIASATNQAVNQFIPEPIQNTISGGVSGAVEQVKSVRGEKFLRKIQRTRDTIALYMPDTLKFSYGQTYRPLELGGANIGAAAPAILSSLSNSVMGDVNNAGSFALNLAAQNSPVARNQLTALAAAATGLVNNPMLEVIYSSPKFRQFSFNFMLYPRSEKEAEQVQKILDTLRFHSAPEIKRNTGGFFLIPPSEFDISFMYNGRPNPNIDKVSTCVLTDISVDYAPKGFHAYEVGGENDAKLGRTGMPVGIGLSLTFMETQILTKEYHRGEGLEKSFGLDDGLGGSAVAQAFPVNTNNPVSKPLP